MRSFNYHTAGVNPAQSASNEMKSLRRILLERLLARRPALALRLSCEQLGILAVNARVPPTSALYRSGGGESIELPVDDIIMPLVLRNGDWQPEELEFIGRHLRADRSVLIDVGANVGLVTRQLMHRLPIAAAVCFEPHPRNFELLTRNLAHLPHCRLVPAAVGSSEGELRFFEEVGNAGNYSLNQDAMRGKAYRTSVVRCLAATEEQLLAPLDASMRGLPLVWKSDTQGFDEAIVTSLPDAFWHRVRCGVMEIWRIERPAFDRARLAQIIGGFAVRRFGDQPERNLEVGEILEYSAGKDYRHQDLLFARQ